ncbi:MAG: hypothetical protein V3T48_07820, partial [Vicinamibacterales bacterium]
KLILGHNADDDSEVKPAIGDVLSVRSGSVAGVAGIFGDVEMSRPDFDQFVGSNRFPRRSEASDWNLDCPRGAL